MVAPSRGELALAGAASLGSSALCVTVVSMALSNGDYPEIESGYGYYSPPSSSRSDDVLCSNTCHHAYDGECDDGGVGSDHSGCSLGTDCYDCGTRSEGSPPRDSCGAAASPQISGAFGVSWEEFDWAECPWRYSTEVFFFLASALPTACALATLAAITFRREQDEQAKQAPVRQGAVSDARTGVCACVCGLVAKLAALLSLPLWFGLMAWFGGGLGGWLGSSLLAGLVVVPAMVVGVVAVFSIVTAIACAPYLLYSGRLTADAIQANCCVLLALGLLAAVVYLVPCWFAFFFTTDTGSDIVSGGASLVELFTVLFVVLVVIIFGGIAACGGACTGLASIKNTDATAKMVFETVASLAYVVLLGAMLVVMSEDIDVFHPVSPDDLLFWSYSLICIDCAWVVLCVCTACLTLAGAIVRALIIAVYKTVKCIPAAGTGVAHGVCGCFAPEIAVLKSCCCPPKAAATTWASAGGPAPLVGVPVAGAPQPTQMTKLRTQMTKPLAGDACSDVESGIDEDTCFYHGTSLEAALSIQKHGFDVEKSGTNAGAMLGPGLYVTASLEKALNYAKRMPAKGVILRLEIDLGKVYQVQPHGPHMRDWQKLGYDSAFSPEGANGVREEHCIRDPNRWITGDSLHPAHKRVEIVDVILGNTRKAQLAGFDVEKGRVVRSEAARP
jgi:hypothetical protein